MNNDWDSESVKRNAKQEAEMFIKMNNFSLSFIMKELEKLYDDYDKESKNEKPNYQLLYYISVKYYILRDHLIHANNLSSDIKRRLDKLNYSSQPLTHPIKEYHKKEIPQSNKKDDIDFGYDRSKFTDIGFYGKADDNRVFDGELVNERPSIPQPQLRVQSVIRTNDIHSAPVYDNKKRYSLPDTITNQRNPFYSMYTPTRIVDPPYRPRMIVYPNVLYPDPPVLLPTADYRNTFSCSDNILSQLDFTKIPDYPVISFGATNKGSVSIEDIK